MSFSLLPVSAVFGGLALLAGILFVLQRLRVRHKEVVVPTTLFWRAAVQETRARVFMRRFRHPLAYALLLLVAALLWLAFAEPVARADRERRATVFLLDGSAGMAWGDRFRRAQDTLTEQVSRLPDGEAEVVFCGGWPRTLLRTGEHPLLLESRLERMRPEACPASLEQAVAMLPRERPTRIVVIGDAPLREAVVPAGWEVLRPGRDSERPANDGVLALGVAEAASGAWDRVDLFVVAPRGYSINLEQLRDVPARGQEVVVRIPAGDAIALDDEARIVLPRRSMLRVKASPELAPVLELDPGVELAEDGVEIELVDGAEITIEGPAGSLASAPGQLAEFVDAERGGDAPRLHRRTGPRRRVVLGRDLLTDRYNFTRTRAFPQFVARAVRWLAGSAEFPAFVAAGEPVRGTEFVPPVAGPFDGHVASLLDPLPRTAAERDDGLAAFAGGGDVAGWLALVAFALLIAEWYFHRTGRVP
ncbi:MAG: vWA domain-containing protein [Planctomycetota bacterium]